MRSTIKQQNKLLDDIKWAVDLRSRKEAGIFLYSNIAPAFKKYGFTLSHYLNGEFSITVNHSDYHYIGVDDLFTPYTTIAKYKSLNS